MPNYNAAILSPLMLLLLLTSGTSWAQESAVGPNGVQDDQYAENFDDDEPASPVEAAEARLQRLFTLYRDAVNDGMYDEADTLAKQIVELTIEINGLDSSVTARAITNLAIAQHGAEDYESAQLNFVAAIEIIERISDRLNEDLINPLKGLAATELAQGNPAKATQTYQRAMHISHVNFGPHNVDQIEMLQAIAETYLAAGEVEEADNVQQRIFALQVRNLNSNSEALLPALISQARWFNRLRLFDKERHAWRRVISILENQRGKNDLSLVPPLIGLGNSYLFLNYGETSRFEPPVLASGEIYLKRAVRITEKNAAAEWPIKTEAMLGLADYYLQTDKPNRAARLYAEVWRILSDGEDRLARRREDLESLKVVQDVAPPMVYGVDRKKASQRTADGFKTGTLVFNYTVTARGRLTNIRLIKAEPEGLDNMERRVMRELRTLVQRPRMVDGAVVSTDDVTYTHEFYYRDSDLPASTTETDEEAL